MRLQQKIDRMRILINDDDTLLIKSSEEFTELAQSILKYLYLKKIKPKKTQELDEQIKNVFEEMCDSYLVLHYIRNIFNFHDNKKIGIFQNEKIDKALKIIEKEIDENFKME